MEGTVEEQCSGMACRGPEGSLPLVNGPEEFAPLVRKWRFHFISDVRPLKLMKFAAVETAVKREEL
jgi:hypothetical protein